MNGTSSSMERLYYIITPIERMHNFNIKKNLVILYSVYISVNFNSKTLYTGVLTRFVYFVVNFFFGINLLERYNTFIELLLKKDE